MVEGNATLETVVRIEASPSFLAQIEQRIKTQSMRSDRLACRTPAPRGQPDARCRRHRRARHNPETTEPINPSMSKSVAALATDLVSYNTIRRIAIDALAPSVVGPT